MSRALAGLACVAAVGAAGVALWNAREVARLRTALEQQALLAPPGIDPLAPADAPGGPTPLAPAARPLPERLTDLETRVAALAERSPAPDTDLLPPLATPPPAPAAPAPSAPADATPGGPAAPVDPAALDAAMEAHARKKVEEAVAAYKRRQNKRPSLETFARELGLDDTQTQAIQQDLERMQLQILEVLRTPTPEGWTFHDTLIDVWADPDPKRQAKRWEKFQAFAKATKVPGTDRSYKETIDALKASTGKGFAQVLTPDQYAGFRSWELDLSGVEFADSPFQTQLRTPVEQLRKERQAAQGSGSDG